MRYIGEGNENSCGAAYPISGACYHCMPGHVIPLSDLFRRGACIEYWEWKPLPWGYVV